MTATLLGDSSDMSSDNASHIEEESESEYIDSHAIDEEEYDDRPRELPQAQAPKKGLRTRGRWRNVIAERIANEPVSGNAATDVGILIQDDTS